MKPFTKYSLRTTTLVIGVILIVLNVAATLFHFIPNFNKHNRLRGMQEAGNRLGAMQGNIESHMQQKDINSIQREFAAQSAYPKYKAIVLINGQNKVIASTYLAWLGNDITETGLEVSKAYIGQSLLHGRIIFNVSKDEKYIYGYAPVYDYSLTPKIRSPEPALIILQYDLAIDQAEHQASYLLLIRFSTIIATLVFLIYWLVIHNIVTLRARHIVGTAQKIAREDKEARCDIDGKDEIALIAKSINFMADTIAESRKTLAQSEERLQLALIGSNDGFWDLEIQTKKAYFSPRFEEMLGYTPGTLEPHIKSWVSLTHPEDRRKVKNAFRKYQTGKTEEFSLKYRVRTAQNDYRWVYTRGKIVKKDRDGKPLRAAGTQQDISEIKAAEEILERQSLALNQLSDGVLITDLTGTIIEWNNGARNLFGYDKAETTGKTFGEVMNILSARYSGEPIAFTPHEAGKSQEGHTLIMPLILKNIKRDMQWSGELEIIAKNGNRIICDVTFVPFTNTESEIVAAIGVCRDITERKNQEAKIHHMATHDPLTRLPNRTLIMDRLRIEMNRTKRSHVNMAVMFLDLDQFKSVNDKYGHESGDQLLYQVADRLASVLRDIDTVGRLGGDEFLIILTDIRQRSEVEDIASRIVDIISIPFYVNDHKVVIHTSIGIRIYSGTNESADALISEADNIMYQVKNSGKNNYKISDKT